MRCRRSMKYPWGVMALMICLMGVTDAHKGSWIYPIYEIPSSELPDLHDGSFDAWEEIVPDASLVTYDFENIGPLQTIDPNDFAVRVFLAWNAVTQRIYVGIQRSDDVLVDTYGGGNLMYLQKFDSMSIALDGDHSGGSYEFASRIPEELLQNDFQAQRYNAITASPDGRMLGLASPFLASYYLNLWVTLPPYGDIECGVQSRAVPAVTWMELYLTPWDGLKHLEPESSVPSLLLPGKIIGFHLTFFDNDQSAQDVEEVYIIKGAFDVFVTADNFVDGELIPCYREDCSGATATAPSAVVEGTWGRIKASFRSERW